MATDYGVSLGDYSGNGGAGGSGSYSYGQNKYTGQPLISQTMLGTIGNDPYSGMPTDSYAGDDMAGAKALANGLGQMQQGSSTQLPNLQTNTSVDQGLMANINQALQGIGSGIPSAPYMPIYPGQSSGMGGNGVDLAEGGDHAQLASMMASGALQGMNPGYLSQMAL